MGVDRPKSRVALLAVTNLGFAYLVSPWPQLATLLGFILGSWLLLQVAGSTAPARRAQGWFRLALVLPVLLLFLVHKLHTDWVALATANGSGHGVPGVLSVITFLGLAYAFMRYSHVAIDICEENLAPPGLIEYTAYVQPWFMALVGPIERLQQFRASVATPSPIDRLTIATSLERVCRGLAKTVLVHWALEGYPQLALHGWSEPLILANLLLVGLYLDFSGYCDIAVGLGRLCGWAPPENFAQPWRSRNLVELWNRWHISLSQWSRDYVFTPLLRPLTRRRLPPLARAAIAYTCSMLVLGLWHEIAWPFVLFGLVHGAGLWLCKAWEVVIRRRFGNTGLQRYLSLRPIRVLAMLITWQFVAFTLLLVRGSLWQQLR